MLIAVRNEQKKKSKKMAAVMDRLHIARPEPRDDKKREASIPDAVLAARKAKKAGQPIEKSKRKTEKDLMLEQGGAGVYSMDYRKQYILDDPDWRWDAVPEFLDGQNVADFVDPEIEARLAELEEEEARLEADLAAQSDSDAGSDIDEEKKSLATKIKTKQTLIRSASMLRKTNNKPQVPRSVMGRKRKRDVDDVDGEEGEDGESKSRSRSRSQHGRSLSRVSSRSRSATVVPGEGYKDPVQKAKAQKVEKKNQRKRNRAAKKGEGDRHVPDLKPKHLYSGKRGMGKTDRR